MDIKSLTAEIFDETQHKSMSSFFNCVSSIFEDTVLTSDDLKSDLIDEDFYTEIQEITLKNTVKLSFGISLRDVRCVYSDDMDREHILDVKYLDKNQICIASVGLPPLDYHRQEFSKLESLITAFTDQVDSLQSYFSELESIDGQCTVVDPLEPSFKYDYRKILLDTRAWLHINVTQEGLPANVTVVGNVPPWHQKLQDGLRHWDYDQCITDNVLKIFGMQSFPSSQPSQTQLFSQTQLAIPQVCPTKVSEISCGICLGGRGDSGAPLPLCNNQKCGVYYHRSCLYAWLVSCGSRAPVGLASGACPNCGHSVHCTERDF